MFGNAQCETKYFLFKTYCMCLYGCQLWDLSSNHFNKFCVQWRKCKRKLFNVPARTHNNLIPLICDDVPVEIQLELRFTKFLLSILSNENIHTRLCGQLCIHGSKSDASNTLNFICEKYKLYKYDLNNYNFNQIKICFSDNFYGNISDDSKMIASNIRDMIKLEIVFHQKT